MSLSKKQLFLWGIPVIIILIAICLVPLKSTNGTPDISHGKFAVPESSIVTSSNSEEKIMAAIVSKRALQERVQVTSQPAKVRSAPIGKVAVARVSAQSAEQLPIESDFVANTDLKIVAIDQMLSEINFDQTFKRFEEQMFRDPLATELGTAYNEEISKKLLEDQTGSRLTKIACGLKICIGSVQSPAGAEFKKWTESLQNNPETPHSSVVYLPSKESPLGTTTRFVFSNDPNVNRVTLPQNTPMPTSATGIMLPPPTPPSGG